MTTLIGVDSQKQRSVIWDYFEKIGTDPVRAACKLCGAEIGKTLNISNYFYHLRSKHMNAYLEARSKKGCEVENKRDDLATVTFGVGDTKVDHEDVSSIVMDNNDDTIVDRKPLANKYKDKTVRRPRSVVWYYFVSVPSDPLRARCKTCNKLCRHFKNTTSLFSHLKTAHPSLYDEARRQRMIETDKYMQLKNSAEPHSPVTITTSKKKPQKFKREYFSPKSPRKSLLGIESQSHIADTSMKQAADKLLLSMISKNLLSPSIVELVGFQELIKIFDGRYDLPSKEAIIKTMLPKLVEETSGKIKLEVAMASYFALSLEVWEYRSTQKLITVMAHFIKDSWEPVSVVLETFDYLEKESSEKLGTELRRVATDWNVIDKVVSIVVDSSETDITTVTMTCGWEDVACFGQVLNSIITQALLSVTEVVRIQRKTSEIVSAFENTVKASETLMSVQQHHNLPGHRLIQEVVGRWNSVFQMMERMVEQFEAVNTVLCYLDKGSMCLCDDEMETMRQIVDVLRPFDSVTKALFTEEFPTMAKVIPLTTVLQQMMASDITSLDASSDAPQDALRNALYSLMQTRFADLEKNYTLAVTTLLDPRFKHHAFTNQEALETAQERLLQETVMLANTAGDTVSVSGESGDTSVDQKSNSVEAVWNIFDKKVCQAGAQKTTLSEAENENRRYFKEAVIPRSNDPLQWWKFNQVQFPHLKILAQKYLCIPANALSSSRLFTEKGEEYDFRRNELTASDVHTMVFLSSNV